METGKLKLHKVILTILYKKKETMEKIIDGEGSEIKLLKLSTLDEN